MKLKECQVIYTGVRLGNVEHIDAALDGQLEYRLRLLLGHARREHRPRAQAHVRYPQAALAQVLVAQTGRGCGPIAQRYGSVGSEAYRTPWCRAAVVGWPAERGGKWLCVRRILVGVSFACKEGVGVVKRTQELLRC